MIDFEKLRKAYQDATGYTVFMEEGELLDFYREKNEIVKPICGTFKVNPVTLTAIQRPFIGIVTANITLLAPPTEWESVRDQVNDIALVLNGTSEKMEGTDGETYSVAYNCETCTVGDRILDLAAGVGEVFPIMQLISYIVIEDGVSAYDAKLWIDGEEVPILSLAENKVVASSVYADGRGTAGMAAETETYGIDFTTPYTSSKVCELFRSAIDGRASGKPHCVVIEKNGKKTAKIMQFGNVSNSVSPPQNIGFNVSLVEAHPLSVDFDGYWGAAETDRAYATYTPNLLISTERNIVKMVFFWGDGSADEWQPGDAERLFHVYTDGIDKHTVRVYKIYDSDTVLLEEAHKQSGLYGAVLTAKKDIVSASIATDDTGEAVIFANEKNRFVVINGGFYLDMGGELYWLATDTIKKGTRIPFVIDYFNKAHLNAQFFDTFLIGREHVKTLLPKPYSKPLPLEV